MGLAESYRDLFGTRRFVSRTKLNTGAVVQFTYDGEEKYAVVLDPEWNGKMHALSLRELSSDQLKNLLSELKGIVDREEIYDKYKSSSYTETRPYRTYLINKMKSLRQIYLKEQGSET